MKKSVLLALIFLSFIPVSFADEIMNVNVDIVVPQDIVEIEVPDYVDLGEINWTYESRTNPTSNDKIYINNTGTVNVSVTPELKNPDEIYEFLHFTKRLSGENFNWTQIGDWSIFIPRSDELGGYEDDYFYMRLDLTDFTGNINQSLIDYDTDVLFVAVGE